MVATIPLSFPASVAYSLLASETEGASQHMLFDPLSQKYYVMRVDDSGQSSYVGEVVFGPGGEVGVVGFGPIQPTVVRLSKVNPFLLGAAGIVSDDSFQRIDLSSSGGPLDHAAFGFSPSQGILGATEPILVPVTAQDRQYVLDLLEFDAARLEFLTSISRNTYINNPPIDGGVSAEALRDKILENQALVSLPLDSTQLNYEILDKATPITHTPPPVVGGVNVNLFGTGEAPGYVDVYTQNSTKFQESRLYSTEIIKDNEADTTFIRGTPMSWATAREMLRMTKIGGHIVILAAVAESSGDANTLSDPNFFADGVTTGVAGGEAMKDIMDLAIQTDGNQVGRSATLVIDHEFGYLGGAKTSRLLIYNVVQ